MRYFTCIGLAAVLAFSSSAQAFEPGGEIVGLIYLKLALGRVSKAAQTAGFGVALTQAAPARDQRLNSALPGGTRAWVDLQLGPGGIKALRIGNPVSPEERTVSRSRDHSPASSAPPWLTPHSGDTGGAECFGANCLPRF